MRGNFLVTISKGRRVKPWLIAVRLFLVVSLALWSLGPAIGAASEEQSSGSQQTEVAPSAEQPTTAPTTATTSVQEQPTTCPQAETPTTSPENTSSQPNSLTPYINTDKADYSPGQSVVITGSGFAAGEPVRIIITTTDGVVVQDNTMPAGADGSVYDTYLVPADGTASLEYFITATGQASGVQATTHFTDTGAVILAPFEIPQKPGSSPPLDPDQAVLAAKLTISDEIYNASAELMDLDLGASQADSYDDLKIDDDNPRTLGTLAAGTYYVYWNVDKKSAAREGHKEAFKVKLSYATTPIPADTTVESPIYTVELHTRANVGTGDLDFLEGAPTLVTGLSVGQSFHIRAKYKETSEIDDLIVQAYYDGTKVRLNHVTIYYYDSHTDPGTVASDVPSGWTTSWTDTTHLGNMDGSALATVIPTLDVNDHWVTDYEFEVRASGTFTISPYIQTKRGTQWKLDSGFAQFTVGNYEQTKISGYKFDDLDGDGTWDQDEPPLQGWEIKAKKESTTKTDTTDDNGYYEFTDLDPGNYTVSETIKSGWVQTHPGSPGTYTIAVQTGHTYPHNNFGNFKKIKISGYKFNDKDGDGVKDAGEEGLKNWTITLSGAASDTDNTDSNGYYSFTNLGPGTYTVSETLKSNWMNTTPTSVIVPATSGHDETVNFGNRKASISGHKFNDKNGNGVWDWTDTNGDGNWDSGEGEPPLSSWKITLSGAASDTDYTDSNGYYEFTDLDPGNYTVSETIKSGWVQTHPGSPGTYTIDVQTGQVYPDKDFGNQGWGHIEGYKFNDKDGHGDKDGSDPLIPGWQITVTGDASTGPYTETKPTGADGWYSFLVPAGTYKVSEEARSGWTQTYPGSPGYHTVTVNPGNCEYYNFGNHATSGSISGMKYEDGDGDGYKDSGEDGLAGWTIFLDANNNGDLDGGELSTTTDSDGNYAFNNVAPGTYDVREILQSSWTQTAPTGGFYNDVTVTAGCSITDKDFGNRQYTDVSVTKTDSPDPVSPGGILTYTITVTNLGPSAAQNVTLSDTPPLGSPQYSTDGGLSWNPWLSPLALGNISYPGSKSVLIKGTVTTTMPIPTTLSNTATVSSSTYDPDLTNNQDSEDTSVLYADISVVKSDAGFDPTVPGGLVIYTITVTNLGPSAAQNVTLSDTPPLGSPQYSTDGGLSWNPWLSPLALGNISYPGSKSVLIKGTVTTTMPIPTSLSNTATVATDTYESDYTNNQDSEETAVVYTDISVVKGDAGYDPSVPGGEVRYTITVTNLGPSAAQNVTLSDTPPLGSPQYSTDGGLNWNPWLSPLALGNISYPGSKSVLIKGTVTTSMPIPTTLSNTATVSSSTYDPDLTNNQDSEDTSVLYADIAVSKTDSPDPVSLGGTLTYTLVVTNNGPSPAENVVVTEAYDSDFTFVSSVPAPSIGNNTWNLGTMAVDETRTITITGVVASPAKVTLWNGQEGEEVWATTSTYDPDLSNNWAIEPTTVLGIITGVVYHDINRNGVQDPGEPDLSGWTVTLYGSDGTTVLAIQLSAADGSYLFDDLPAGVYYVEETLLTIDWDLTTPPIKRKVTIVEADGKIYPTVVDFGNDIAVLPFTPTPRAELPRTGGNSDLGIYLGQMRAERAGNHFWLMWIAMIGLLGFLLSAAGLGLTLTNRGYRSSRPRGSRGYA